MNRHDRRAAVKTGIKRMLPVLQQRPCGTCTACCSVMRIDALRKPAGAPCKHERGPSLPPGCGIYSRRPNECSTFFCAWRTGVGRDDERPDRIGFLMYAPGKVANGPIWYAVRDVVDGSGAGWAARERIEAVAMERGAGIGVCTPLTPEVEQVMGSAYDGDPPPYGSRVTVFFGPRQAVLAAQRQFNREA